MAKPNYAFAKQQRDLAKEQKKEEKRLRRQAHEQEHRDAAEVREHQADPLDDEQEPR